MCSRRNTNATHGQTRRDGLCEAVWELEEVTVIAKFSIDFGLTFRLACRCSEERKEAICVNSTTTVCLVHFERVLQTRNCHIN